MTEKPAEQVLKDLADKIRAELPEELAVAVHFEGDGKGNLFMDFAVQLDKSDYPLVLGVVKKFNGDFVNRKENGKDVGCFLIPKPKPAVTPAPTVASPAPSTPAEVKLQEQAKAPSDDKPEQVLKQPSPVSVFADNYCSVCVDFGVNCSCKANSEYRALCLKVLKIQLLQQINVNLERLGKLPLSKVSEPAKIPEQAKAEKVERNTRPTEGHREGDIVWVFDENQKGERYEKAFEKDNVQSSPYFQLRDQIVERVNAGKKGLELRGNWLWFSERGDYIGRKAAKQFSKGNRR